MDSNIGKSMPYRDLPRVTPNEFDELVRIARAYGKSWNVMSDDDVAMARAVMIEGVTYKQASFAQGATSEGGARRAVKTLMHFAIQDPTVQPPVCLGEGGAGETERRNVGACRYSDLPKLTFEEFEALATIGRRKANARRRISDRSIAIARVVLLEAATYTEAGLAYDRPPSSAYHAVYGLLKNLHRILRVPATGVCVETTGLRD